MAGVNIMVRGPRLSVITDIDGSYTLNVPNKDAILVFSFIGYQQGDPIGRPDYH